MTTLTINDLAASTELDSKAMAGVVGGFNPFAVDASTTLTNKVADVSQLFEFGFAQTNAGQLTNNQAIGGGNGIIDAPVTQDLYQNNDLYVYDIGNTSVS